MGMRVLVSVIVLAAALLLWRSMFIVNEGETAYRTRFGQVQGAACDPGLHFKSPLDEVRTFDRRVMSRLLSGESFLTRDQKALNVDFYIKWRLIDPQRFDQAVGGDEDMAAMRLADQVRDRLKSAAAGQTLTTVIADPRATLSPEAFTDLQKAAETLGLDLIDVQIHRVDLSDDVAGSVYQRMQQGLVAKAQQLRGTGSVDA